MASAGCETANLGTEGHHATSRPPKLLAAIHTGRFNSKISAFSPHSVLCFQYNSSNNNNNNNKRLNGSTIFVSVKEKINFYISSRLILFFKSRPFTATTGFGVRVVRVGQIGTRVGGFRADLFPINHIPLVFHIYLCNIRGIDNGHIMIFSSTEKCPSPAWQRNEAQCRDLN
jgi:hypothetical protein